MSDSEKTNDLDSYGVWVKKPPRTIDSSSTPNSDDFNINEEPIIDNDLPDFSSFDSGDTALSESELMAITNSMADDTPIVEESGIVPDEFNEASDGFPENINDSQISEPILENDTIASDAEPEQEEQPAETDSTEDKIDGLDNFFDVSESNAEEPFSFDSFENDNNTSSNDMEEVDLSDFGFTNEESDSSQPEQEETESPSSESETESISIDDFMEPPEDTDLSDNSISDVSVSPSTVPDDGPLDIDLSFDDSPAPETTDSLDFSKSFDEADNSAAGTENVDLSEFGMDDSSSGDSVDVTNMFMSDGGNDSPSEEVDVTDMFTTDSSEPEAPQETSSSDDVDVTNMFMDSEPEAKVAEEEPISSDGMEDVDLSAFGFDDAISEEPPVEETSVEPKNTKDTDMTVIAEDDDFEEPTPVDAPETVTTDTGSSESSFDIDSILDGIEDENGNTVSLNENSEEQQVKIDKFPAEDEDEVVIQTENFGDEVQPEIIDKIPEDEGEPTTTETTFDIQNEIPDTFEEETASLMDDSEPKDSQTFADTPVQEEPAVTEKPAVTQQPAATDDTAAQTNAILSQIVNQLSSLKDEISTLKNDVETLKQTKNELLEDSSSNIADVDIPETQDEGGFFGNSDEDETIALSIDELDNILNTADVTETTEAPEQANNFIANDEVEDSSFDDEADDDTTSIIEDPTLESLSNARLSTPEEEPEAEDESDLFESDDQAPITEPIIDETPITEEPATSEDAPAYEETPAFAEETDSIPEETTTEEPVVEESFADNADETTEPATEEIADEGFGLDFSNSELEAPVLDDINLDLADDGTEDLPDEITVPKVDDIMIESSATDLITESTETAQSQESDSDDLSLDGFSFDEPAPIAETETEGVADAEPAEVPEVTEPELSETDTIESVSSEPVETEPSVVDMGLEEPGLENSLISDEEVNEPESTETVETTEEINDTETSKQELDNLLAPEIPIEESLTEANLSYLTSDPELNNAVSEETQESADKAYSSIPNELQKEIKSVLSYMDQLLENLPEEKIAEFAQSEQFETYKKLFNELGLA
jgi:hypothetical protein